MSDLVKDLQGEGYRLTAICPALKTTERAYRKAFARYGGKIGRLTDIARRAVLLDPRGERGSEVGSR